MSGKIDAPDIETIMVEAAEAERARYSVSNMSDDPGVQALIRWDNGSAVVARGSAGDISTHLDHLVVQAQLRALHAAGLGIASVAHIDAYWGPDSGDLIPVALRENG